MKYFSIDEMCKSQTAKEHNINNTPPVEVEENLRRLIVEILDPIRNIYGKPIMVTSGYRCKELNDLIGGSPNSQHCSGEAADLRCDNNLYIFNLIKDNFIFDQLINEWPDQNGCPSWVHVSFKKGKNRREVLLKNKNGYRLCNKRM